MLAEQAAAWAAKWAINDIIIKGDVSAQQGIRFNIFQLNQTYTGADDRLNIGPKGFTGEKYGGSTYWDTEAYCLPFFLSTAEEKVARNLLVYRYKHLPKAIVIVGRNRYLASNMAYEAGVHLVLLDDGILGFNQNFAKGNFIKRVQE